MPHTAKSHDENRLALCLLCLGNSKEMRPINSRHNEIINKYMYLMEYNVDDNRLPSALCSTCRTVVLDYGRGIFKRHLVLADHSLMTGTPPYTRSHSHCPCVLCQLASANINSTTSLSTKMDRGRPQEINEHREVVRLCCKCLSAVAKGCEHKCCETSRRNNIQDFINNSNQNTKE